MKPYYEYAGIALYHGDCRELIPRFNADVVVTDPPYGETRLHWDVPIAEWIPNLRTNVLWCFGSLRAFMETADEFDGWSLAQDIVWEKHNGSSLRNDRFRRVHEHAVQFYRGTWESVWKKPVYTLDAVAKTVRAKSKPTHWHGAKGASTYVSEDGGPRLMRSVISVRSENGRAEHPTQKPIGIVRPLIQYSCPPGGRVLDPFAGSGTTLLAAKELGMSAIGIEVNEAYCEIAAKRLAQELLPFESRVPVVQAGGEAKS